MNAVSTQDQAEYARYVDAGERGLLGDGPTTFEAWKRGEYAQQPAARFEKVLDAGGAHIITRDTLTGLEWSARDIGSFTNAVGSKAEAACSALTLGGHADWRLPTIDELESIRDRSRYSPAIDIKFFPGCPPDWFWTSTPHAYNPAEYAWIVGFYDGYSGYGYRHKRFRVRAVRGPSRQFSAPLPHGSEG